MGLSHSPRIVTDGLVLCLDAANSKSYNVGVSTINFKDLITGSISTNINDFGYDTTSYSVPVLKLNTTTGAGGTAITSNGQVQVVTQDLNTLAITSSFSVMFAAKKNFFGLAGNNNGNSQLFQGVTNGYNTGWRIQEGTQGTPGNVYSSRHSWSFGYNDIDTGLSVNDSTSSTNRMCIVGFTVSPTGIVGFCNGTTSSRSGIGTYDSGTSQPRISFTGAGVGSWNGLVGFFMIYNRTLSLAELQQNYNALKGRFGL
jgi:hypothetical protein